MAKNRSTRLAQDVLVGIEVQEDLARVPPAFAVDGYHGLGGLGEGGRVQAPLEGEGTAARPCGLAVLERGLPGFGQRDVGEAAEACVAAAAVDRPRQIQCFEIDFRLRDS